MNKRSTKAFRFAIHGVALAVTGLLGSQAYALGLGRVTVRFEGPLTPPGPIRTFRDDDPQLRPVAPPDWRGTPV